MITRVEADYLIETAGDPRKVAEVMAGEQSSGLTSWYPGVRLRAHGHPLPPPSSPARAWTAASVSREECSF